MPFRIVLVKISASPYAARTTSAAVRARASLPRLTCQNTPSVEDVGSTSSRRSVYVPLYPLAEWIAFNWWLLAANTRPATILARLHRRDDFFDQVPRRRAFLHHLRPLGPAERGAGLRGRTDRPG
jgi:hypothetical protein